jgi:hypothetical protein
LVEVLLEAFIDRSKMILDHALNIHEKEVSSFTDNLSILERRCMFFYFLVLSYHYKVFEESFTTNTNFKKWKNRQLEKLEASTVIQHHDRKRKRD